MSGILASATSAENGVSPSSRLCRTATLTKTQTDTLVPLLTATDTANRLTSSQQTFVIPLAAVALTMTGLPSPLIAGASTRVVVWARDVFGNLTPDVPGTLQVSSSDPRASLPADFTISVFTGPGVGVNIALDTAGTQSFGVLLDDGQEIRGVLVEGEIEDISSLLNQRVLVVGKAVYRASGRLLRIDAEAITKTTEEGRFFSSIPKPVRQKFDLRDTMREQQHKLGVAAVIGKWPGDETEEEIRQALKELS